MENILGPFMWGQSVVVPFDVSNIQSFSLEQVLTIFYLDI